jgi:MFS superfamily sulfate permease-like transporter
MILGVVNGMIVAVALSIAATLERMSNPTIARLGMLGESRNFVDVSYLTEAKTDPHILILRPSQPLFFANAEATLSRVVALATASEVRTTILSLEDSDSLDSTALDALLECEQTLADAGRALILARVKQDILDALARTGPEGASLQSRCFFSIADAYERVLQTGSDLNASNRRISDRSPPI